MMVYHHNDEVRNEESKQFLNSLANSHSIKDEILKKISDRESLQNVSKVTSITDKVEDNSDGTYKNSNFL